MIKTLIDIITSPKEAFVSIKEKPSILFPLVLIMLTTASLQWGYFSAVDPDFLIDDLVAQSVANSNAPEDQIRANLESVGTNTIMISSVVGVLIIVPIIMALYAGYLSLISKFTYDEITYKQWFSLTCWTGIPTVFVALSGWMVILMNSDGLISAMDIQPLSLNNLLLGSEGPFANMLNSLNLMQIWSLALSALGYQHWTGKGLGKSLTVILGPYIVIYGIWAIFILT